MKPALPSDSGPPASSQGVHDRSLPQRRGAARAKAAATLFCAVFLSAQVLIPVVQLILAPRPARFGWQMFSVSAPPPTFTVVLDNGTANSIALEPFVSSLRGDVPLVQFLPLHLCRVVPHVQAVRYQFRDAPRSETYRCSI